MPPLITALDHIVVVVRDLDAAAAPFEGLGLNLSPVTRHAGAGTSNRVFFVGDEHHFYVELLAVHDDASALLAGRDAYVALAAKGGGVARLMLEVDDLAAAVARLEAMGHPCAVTPVSREGGGKICDVANALGPTPAGCEFGLIQYALPRGGRTASRRARGLFEHGFPLKRLDHLALVSHGPAAACRFWEDAFGVPVAGEVVARGMRIQQLRIGDAVLEVISAANPASPIAARPEGLLPMASFEVPDVDAAVAAARGKGFTLPDAAEGVLPGTRTATLPADQLGGALSMQLLGRVGGEGQA
ncbi:Glyoxalase/Bleomycin resistance protein/Dihydroxybiphenyl dioxygenase [Hyaloraphidium curvatum]|nr:Glyoxalase/Bleomycin resistance protein/Dihydroxybiphenyl dioxygenase [Hyaloraphidium curvatum]